MEPGDYTELARAILTLRRNPELCEKLGKNGLLAVTNEASIGAIGKKMKAILKLATL